MKAVVIAIKNDMAAVAFTGGRMQYIKNDSYETGQILDLPVENITPIKKGLSLPHFGSSLAAAASLLIFAGAVSAYAMPLSFVTIDVNPSLSMGVNMFNRVIEAEYGNDDGKELLSGISRDIMGKELPDAVDTLFTGLKDNDYINEMDTPAEGTVRGVISDRNNERLITELNQSVDAWNKKQDKCSVSFEAVSVTREMKKEADEKGITPGRMMLEKRQKDTDQNNDIPELYIDDKDKNTPSEEFPSIELPSEEETEMSAGSNIAGVDENPSVDTSENTDNDKNVSSEEGKNDDKNSSGKNKKKDEPAGGKNNTTPPDNGQGAGIPSPDNGQNGMVPVPDNGQGGMIPVPDNGQNGMVPSPDNGQGAGIPVPDNGQNGMVPAPDNGQGVGIPVPDNGQNGMNPSPGNSSGDIMPPDNGNGGNTPPPDNGGNDGGHEPDNSGHNDNDHGGSGHDDGGDRGDGGKHGDGGGHGGHGGGRGR